MNKKTLLTVLCFIFLMTLFINSYAAGYICRYKKNIELTNKELEPLSIEQLGFLRNEIFARYGREFKSEKYRTFFKKQPWYKIDPKFSQTMLTKIDRENIDLIKTFEAQKSSPNIKSSNKPTVSKLEKHFIKKNWDLVNFGDSQFNSEMSIVFSSNGKCVLSGEFQHYRYEGARTAKQDHYITTSELIKGEWKIEDDFLLVIFYRDDYSGKVTYASSARVSKKTKNLNFILYDKENSPEVPGYVKNEKLLAKDLISLPDEQLKYLKNKVYAVYGRKFTSYKYHRFFSDTSWYKINPEFSNKMLTKVDKKNLKLIQSILSPSDKDAALIRKVIYSNIVFPKDFFDNIPGDAKGDGKITNEFTLNENGTCQIDRYSYYMNAEESDAGAYLRSSHDITSQGIWRVYKGYLYIFLDGSTLRSKKKVSDYSKDIKVVEVN